MIKRKFDKESINNLKRDFLSYYELLENCNNMSKLDGKISELNSKIHIDSLYVEFFKSFIEDKRFKLCYDSLYPAYNNIYMKKRLMKFSYEYLTNKDYENSIDYTNIKELEDSFNFFGVSWMFYSKEKKLKLNNYYDDIVNRVIINNKTKDDVEKAYNELMVSPNKNEVLENYNENSDYYNRLLNKYLPNYSISNLKFKPFEKVMNSYDRILSELQKIEHNKKNINIVVSQLRNYIKDTAYKYHKSIQDYDKVDSIYDSPIDILSKYNINFSENVLKKLKGGGFRTINDLRNVTEVDLEKIFINVDYYFNIIYKVFNSPEFQVEVNKGKGRIKKLKKINLSLTLDDPLYQNMLQYIRLYKDYLKYMIYLRDFDTNSYNFKLLEYTDSYMNIKKNILIFNDLKFLDKNIVTNLMIDYDKLLNIDDDFQDIFSFIKFNLSFLSIPDLYKDLDEYFITYNNILEELVPELLLDKYLNEEEIKEYNKNLDTEKESEIDNQEVGKIESEDIVKYDKQTINRYGLSDKLYSKISTQEIDTNGLFSVLRPYQVLGVKYILSQGNVLLGDEMGLGKTIQAIASIVCLYNAGERHFVVVAPLSVLENWSREINKHSNLKIYKCHGNDRDNIFNLWTRRGGVLLTTYDIFYKLSIMEYCDYSLVVFDEAHKIKNRETKRAKNALNLIKRSNRVLLLTGTALENKKSEMINLISYLNPELSDNLKHMNSKEYYHVVEPVYYRRKREDVLHELPELMDIIQWCDLYDEERKMYEDDVMSGKHYQQLRQLSFNSNKSSKLEAIEEIVAMAKEDKRRLVIFSFFLNTLDVIHKKFSNSYIINGSVKESERVRILDEFEKSPPGTLLLLQIDSGGTGLNIQSASVVVICEPQYKPSTELQAISRTYRMGQRNSVLVYRLICKDTIEERILGLLESKQLEFDIYADNSIASEKDKIHLKDNDMKSLLEKEIKRIKQKRISELKD